MNMCVCVCMREEKLFLPSLSLSLSFTMAINDAILLLFHAEHVVSCVVDMMLIIIINRWLDEITQSFTRVEEYK